MYIIYDKFIIWAQFWEGIGGKILKKIIGNKTIFLEQPTSYTCTMYACDVIIT